MAFGSCRCNYPNECSINGFRTLQEPPIKISDLKPPYIPSLGFFKDTITIMGIKFAKFPIIRYDLR